MQDHVVSNLHGKVTPFSMWKALAKLFKYSSDHRKLALKDKLQNIKMQKNDIIQRYLSTFTQVHSELGGVGLNFLEYDLVSLSLLGLPKS